MSRPDDTIAALSTAAGESGIAVIRMSGDRAFDIVAQLLRRSGETVSADALEHRRIYHGTLQDGDERIDDVMCAVMEGPETYTGENVVEVSCHGNTLIVKRILGALFDRGARPAEAGEFTKRAFLNGKMDLIQAEAVADLIHARTDLQRDVAQAQLAGGLSSRIDELADEMVGLQGEIEVGIDFVEENIETVDIARARQLVASQIERLDGLLKSRVLSRPFHEGYRVAIVGPVNSGKSALFNRMLEEGRAIVTDVPGTTRDVLREPVTLDGLLFILQDTAGLRGTDDAVENIGIGRARSAALDADIVVQVVDGSECSAAAQLDDGAGSPPDGSGSPALDGNSARARIVVVNKSDLPWTLDPGVLSKQHPDATIVATSALTGNGIDELRAALVDCVGRDRLNWIARERIVINTRLAFLLDQARDRVAQLDTGLKEGRALELLAADARHVLESYETATGRRYSSQLLDTIFSRFCIGK